MLVGYCRTSTTDQIAGIIDQKNLVSCAGCEKVFEEMVSSVTDRPQLVAALDFVREGDSLIVTRLDRLARSTADLLSIVSTLDAKSVALRILDFGGGVVDTRSATGRLLLTVLGAVAECERMLMLERQKAGIAKAKAEGRYKGRAPTARAKAPQMHALREEGLAPSTIAIRLGVSRASVYRLLAEGSPL
jgi:DNA invertase Pin-like site-specific DNA recombinase